MRSPRKCASPRVFPETEAGNKMLFLRLRDNFIFSQHIFFPFAALSLAALSVYRAGVYPIIIGRYPEFSDRGVVYYFMQSAVSDAPALLVMLCLLSLVLTALSETEKLKFIAAGLLTGLYMLVHLAAIEFFRIYETPYHPAFLGGGALSGAGEMLISAFAELSPQFYSWLIALSVFFAAATALLYRRDRHIYYDGVTIGLLFYGLSAVHLLIIILLFAVTLFGDQACDDAGSNAAHGGRVTYSELSANPFSNMFNGNEDDRVRYTLTSGRRIGKADSATAWTDSLENRREYRRDVTLPRKRYNIILYMFESFPSEYLGMNVNGIPVTPVWDRLRRNAFSALNHYANNPLSANALINILASAHEPSGGRLLIERYPRVPLKTLPDILHDAGYRTVHVHTGGLAYAGQDRFLKNRGYDSIMDYFHLRKISPGFRDVGWGIDERAMIDPALTFIKKDPSRPFLAVFQPVNPHHPYAVPGKEFDISGEVPRNAPEWTRSWHKYVDSLHYADAVLGALVDRLEEEGLMENTLLFLVADHGEAFYQHRQNYNHPFFIYQENVHVPFLIYNRNLFRVQHRFMGVSRHVDILPTILDLLGLPSGDAHQGVPLFGRRREQMALLHTAWRDHYLGVRDGRWKYIIRKRDGFEELYDLNADPRESVNLAGVKKDIVLRYRTVIEITEARKKEYYRNLLDRI